MTKMPKQRKPGQTGGGGRINHTGARVHSASKGGNPYRGGAGTGKTPNKGSGGGSKSMVVIAVAMLILPFSAVATVVGYVVANWGQ